MKKVILIFTAIVCVPCMNKSFAQKDKKAFQGTITYDITYTGDNINPALKAQLPSLGTVTIKDCKSKTEQAVGGMTQSSISDGTSKSEIILIDLMGTKYALKLSAQEIADEMAKAPVSTVNITTGTKVIAGYTCKQAILTSKDEDGNITTDTIYFSEEIGCKDINFSDPNFKDIPGTVLEYSQFSPQIGATVTYKVKEIKKSKISDNVFLIPSDFKEVTKEELKKAFGGDEDE